MNRGQHTACVDCDTPLTIGRRTPIKPGTRRHVGRGKCTACYVKQQRIDTPRVRKPRPPKPPKEPKPKVVLLPPPTVIPARTEHLDGGWKLHAACRDKNPDLFTPASDHDRAYMKAARICNGDPTLGTPACPVRDECLRYALRTETPSTRHGMYGGTTPRQRARLAQEMTA